MKQPYIRVSKLNNWLDYDVTLQNKSIKFAASIEIFASKFPNVIIVMESYRPKRLTITLNCTCKLHVSFLCPHF